MLECVSRQRRQVMSVLNVGSDTACECIVLKQMLVVSIDVCIHIGKVKNNSICYLITFVITSPTYIDMEYMYILQCNCFASMCVLLIVIIMPYAETMTWKFKKTVGIKSTNSFAERESLSDISCMDFCLATGGCVVANYNPGTRTCAIVDGFQKSGTNANWHTYDVISGMPSRYFCLSFLCAIWT